MEHPPFDFQKVIRNRPWFERAIETVSYTHLTLPTKRIV